MSKQKSSAAFGFTKTVHRGVANRVFIPEYVDEVKGTINCSHCTMKFKTKQALAVHAICKHPSFEPAEKTAELDRSNEYTRNVPDTSLACLRILFHATWHILTRATSTALERHFLRRFLRRIVRDHFTRDNFNPWRARANFFSLRSLVALRNIFHEARPGKLHI